MQTHMHEKLLRALRAMERKTFKMWRNASKNTNTNKKMTAEFEGKTLIWYLDKSMGLSAVVMNTAYPSVMNVINPKYTGKCIAQQVLMLFLCLKLVAFLLHNLQLSFQIAFTWHVLEWKPCSFPDQQDSNSHTLYTGCLPSRLSNASVTSIYDFPFCVNL